MTFNFSDKQIVVTGGTGALVLYSSIPKALNYLSDDELRSIKEIGPKRMEKIRKPG